MAGSNASFLMKRGSFMQNDTELLNRAVDGDHDAFDALLARYRDAVYRQVLRRVGDPQDAEEVTQNVFIKVYLNLGSFRGDGDFAAWVRSIVHRESLTRVRGRRPMTVELSSYAEILADGEATPEQMVLNDERRRAVRRALESLPEHERRVAQAFYMEGLSYREIQNRHGLARSSIADYLYRARRHLARRLEGVLSLVWLPGWRSFTLLELGVASGGSTSAPLAKAAVVTVTAAAVTAMTTTVLPPSHRRGFLKPTGGVAVRETKSERDAKGDDLLTRALSHMRVRTNLTFAVQGTIPLPLTPVGPEGPRDTRQDKRVKADKAREEPEEAREQVGEEKRARDEAEQKAREKARERAKEAEEKAQEKARERAAKAEEKAREKAREQVAKAEEKARERVAKAEEKAAEAERQERAATGKRIADGPGGGGPSGRGSGTGEGSPALTARPGPDRPDPGTGSRSAMEITIFQKGTR
jgi:RNA polymerase sigma-70 factor (ECF subfamily)